MCLVKDPTADPEPNRSLAMDHPSIKGLAILLKKCNIYFIKLARKNKSRLVNVILL
ncbi:hypothetical protein SPHINGO8BC_60148 [Sphingobacterium multivorum]|uniref:Uncharacterized protein n=1 Tax=Sphingobacterium multivorum TaxID=28454 RepID=A0A654DDU0_SPHMU|nr:hypothetical protein SPHINGO8BC_60148 [Sphingobacterium multivorum]